ncbi:ATP-binding protein [Runella sp.]|jgi:hypothetical protein|uniref:ATP-binding protein n=1 Tax=Runella sp. TaxID=1960881 RepID=UPI00262EBA77|nr:ATP-binding protein [Runella sp.]
MYERHLFAALKEHLTKPQATVITGLRRVGKTTALKYLLDTVSHSNKLYLDFEKIENRVLFSENSYSAIESGLQALGLHLNIPCVLALDEIQLVPASTSVVKYLYDTYGIKFLLSGSSSYYIKNHFTESLAGRKRIFELYPLAFDEFLAFQGYDSFAVSSFKLQMYQPFIYLKFKQSYETFLQFGGFPEVVMAETQEDKIAYLKDIINAYIELDIKLLSDFKASNELYKLIQLLASRVGSRLDISKLSSISGINRHKLADYLELLEYTYFIYRIPAFTKNKDKEISSQTKLYLADTGLLHLLAQVSSGQVFENAIAQQLKNLGEVAYFQKKSGQEIDFILNQNTAVEVKETPSYSDLKTLNYRADDLSLEHRWLIGRTATAADFRDWYWGGSIF